MAKSKLSSTAAIVSEPLRHGYESTVSVRRIDNGYVTRRSHCDNNGNYKSEETYSAGPPGRDAKAEKHPVGKSSLAVTKAYLGKDI